MLHFGIDFTYNLNKAKLEKCKTEILAGQKDLTHLKRTFKFDELTIEMKSGHSYFRKHSGGNVSRFASLNEIETEIIDDFIEQLEQAKTNKIDLIQEGFTEHLSVFVNGHEVEYEPFRRGNFYSFDYYPKTRNL
jgi:chromatin segregation and condensation protein Rec8/ScpA/Scc1 (kleisin family)